MKLKVLVGIAIILFTVIVTYFIMNGKINYHPMPKSTTTVTSTTKKSSKPTEATPPPEKPLVRL